MTSFVSYFSQKNFEHAKVVFILCKRTFGTKSWLQVLWVTSLARFRSIKVSIIRIKSIPNPQSSLIKCAHFEHAKVV